MRRNLQAFRRGRQLVDDPEAFTAAATPGPSVSATAAAGRVHPAAGRVRAMVGAEPGSELARLLDIRVPDLIAYQDERYAEFVERVRRHEPASTEVTEAVARNLYKLMAYKDEYEVGTRLDLFGDAEVRRVERELIQEYRDTILEALAAARPAADLDAVVELAELPDLVRGYEQIKLDNVDTYHRRRSELLEKLRPAPAPPPPSAHGQARRRDSAVEATELCTVKETVPGR
ncbi:DUF6537 domain-containing protein [Streptomyces sp. NPDC127074]|uniref:DUF6537 domain-containing protein n=1 Tax=Streptomyces sp. NPDC127074 TaxID=3347130 RepID=UPI0036525CAC